MNCMEGDNGAHGVSSKAFIVLYLVAKREHVGSSGHNCLDLTVGKEQQPVWLKQTVSTGFLICILLLKSSTTERRSDKRESISAFGHGLKSPNFLRVLQKDREALSVPLILFCRGP